MIIYEIFVFSFLIFTDWPTFVFSRQLPKLIRILQEKTQQSASGDQLLRDLENYASAFPDKYSFPLAVQNLEALAISLRTESFRYGKIFWYTFENEENKDVFIKVCASGRKRVG